MKKSIFYALMAGVFAFAAAACDPKEDQPAGPDEGGNQGGGSDSTEVVIPTPAVAGEAGKYTIAFLVDQPLTCDVVINLFGGFQENNTEDAEAPIAEPIVAEGFENWYKVVFEAADASTAKGKICPQVDGKGSWNAQGTYELIKGDATIADDYGKANQIVCNEGALGNVVYVEVTKWAVDPCARPNEAGPASYELIIKTEFPADLDPYDLTVAATVNWNCDAMEMTYDPTYTGEGLKFTGSAEEVPAAEMYKYVIKYKESAWIYEKGDNRAMNYERDVKDEVTEWDSTPWNPIPGGEGTFEITLCEAPAAEVYIAGPFSAEGEGSYWGECVGNEAYKMTLKEGNTYTWTGAYPENFAFQVVDNVEGSPVWIGKEGPSTGNFEFDGENFAYSVACE